MRLQATSSKPCMMQPTKCEMQKVMEDRSRGTSLGLKDEKVQALFKSTRHGAKMPLLRQERRWPSRTDRKRFPFTSKFTGTAEITNLHHTIKFLHSPFPVFFLNSFLKCSSIAASKSSPPKCVLPAVALTVKTPPWMCRRETSKVPPPRS